MSPSRRDTVHRAVALIGPDEARRAECVTAVHVALTNVGGTAEYMQQQQRSQRRGKRADARLQKVLEDLQKAIQDPNVNSDLSDYLRGMFPPVDLAHVIARVEEERTKPVRKSAYKAQKKYSAVCEAHHLLEQFKKKISAEKGSVFCRLAALLYGEPRASLTWNCRQVIASLVPPSRVPRI